MYQQRFSVNMARTLLEISGMKVYCQRCDINIIAIDFVIYAI